MADTLSVKWIKYLFGEQNIQQYKKIGEIVIDEMISKFKMDNGVLTNTYMADSAPHHTEDGYLDHLPPLQFTYSNGIKYRAYTLNEYIRRFILAYIQEVDQYVKDKKENGYFSKASTWKELKTSLSKLKRLTLLNNIEKGINAYFYQIKNTKSSESLPIFEKMPTSKNIKNSIKVSNTNITNHLDALWLTFYHPQLEKETAIKQRIFYLQEYEKKGLIPPIQVFDGQDPIQINEETTNYFRFIIENIQNICCGEIDYAWRTYRTKPDFAKIIAYQNVVIDELKKWRLNSTSKALVINGFRKRTLQNGTRNKINKNNKNNQATYVQEPNISYQYEGKKYGKLSQDELQTEIIKHINTNTGFKNELGEYHRSYLNQIINIYFYNNNYLIGEDYNNTRNAEQPVNKSGPPFKPNLPKQTNVTKVINSLFPGKRPTSIISQPAASINVAPINAAPVKVSSVISQPEALIQAESSSNASPPVVRQGKTYRGTVKGRNHNVTVSKRESNAPLSNGQIPTQIENRMYIVNVTGGYKTRKSRRYSAFRVKNNK